MSQEQGIVREFVDEIDPLVFGFGILTAVTFLGYVLLVGPDQAGTTMEAINDWLWTNFSWFYLWAMLIFVGFTTFLIFGPWGKIKLGPPDAEPRHDFLTYFAMFFSAGIAAGIVFWGPAEAIFHYGSGTPLAGADAPAKQRMLGSLQYTFFHWGISAWAAYLIVGVPIGYFAHKKGAPFKFSTVIAPIVGVENLDDSYFARLVDLIAVFGTMGGIATSLGFIGQQLLMGMDYQFGSVRTPSASASALPLDIFGVQLGDLGIILVIIGVTTVFTLSVISGVEKGIKRLSQLNVIVFVSLGVLVFFIGIYNGMASFVLNLGTQAVGQYFNQFIKMSLFTGAATDSSFLGSWTIFYWAWWFSWAPFSGIFLARISYGRTIREVTFVGVIATTLATVPWFLVIGGMSMRMQQLGQADILGVLANYGGNEAVSGYPLFGALPAGALLSGLFFLLVITFFVTSADSSTLGIAMLTTGGEENPSELNRLIWGVLQGLVAAVLIVIGGTNALQQAAIITGGPVAIIGLIGVYGMVKEFSSFKGRVLVQEGASIRDDDTLLGGRSSSGGGTSGAASVRPAESDEDD
ncbi:BCCT family transporter [Haladaptatus sp. T7]|uniref:BCCT family transporter n=1 Tax=Haladaptatus sp. T7 TaxID=2029368 RepID=UPI0021A25245|nr:BCCT family transporter [Haladaptatus sp. T7]GKZ14603.1 glycine/betaine ABC transporter [Haladaptatus sp. T7]